MLRPAGRILVADDDTLNSTLLRVSLEEEGFIVETAADGRQALDLLHAQPFDILLLDLLDVLSVGPESLFAMDDACLCHVARAQRHVQGAIASAHEHQLLAYQVLLFRQLVDDALVHEPVFSGHPQLFGAVKAGPEGEDDGLALITREIAGHLEVARFPLDLGHKLIGADLAAAGSHTTAGPACPASAVDAR